MFPVSDHPARSRARTPRHTRKTTSAMSCSTNNTVTPRLLIASRGGSRARRSRRRRALQRARRGAAGGAGPPARARSTPVGAGPWDSSSTSTSASWTESELRRSVSSNAPVDRRRWSITDVLHRWPRSRATVSWSYRSSPWNVRAIPRRARSVGRSHERRAVEVDAVSAWPA